MRPHVLELKAFGAFPGEVRLDLDLIGEHGLVLLCGDTGGGKTTLLDALGFALYGVVPGERHKAREDLRSHHAPAGASAEVKLEFTARGRRLRVTRTPMQTRPKKRGDGVIVENPTALLESWDGADWTPLAQRPEDVGLEIGQLLGMDASQFFQVVILPQGGFAAFLQADHKDREKLLKQLFHVDRFEQVERWLATRAIEATSQVEAGSNALDLAAARLAQEAGVEPPADLEAASDWAQELAEDGQAAAQAAAVVMAQEQTARARAHQQLADAEVLAAGQQARRAAETELARLALLAEEFAVLRCERDAAERARPVQVALDAQDRAAAALHAAQAASESDRAALELLVATGPQTSLDLAADEATLRTQAAELHTETGRLEALLDVAARADEAETEARTSAAEADQLGEALAEVQAVLSELPAQRDRAQQLARSAAAAERALPAARLAREQALATAALAEEAAELLTQQVTLAAQVQAAAAASEQAAVAAAQLRDQRVDALLAELAGALADGAPCAVCGATVHPAPATGPTEQVDNSVERQAEAVAAQARDAQHALELVLARLVERLAGVTLRLDPAPGDLTVLAAEIDDLQAVATAGAAATEALSALQGRAENCLVDLVRLETRQTAERKRAAEALATATALRARLVRELGEGVQLTTRRRELAALATAATATADGLARAEAAREGFAAAHQTAGQLVTAAGFVAEGAVRDAVRSQQWLTSTTQALVAQDEQVTSLQAKLLELDLPLDPPAPVDACRAAADAATASYEHAVGEQRILAARSISLTALVGPYAAALAELGPLRQQAAELKGLADVAAGRGANRLSMPLSTYVLAARLEEVARSASVRLSRMSGGRYTLTHTDSGRDKRRRAGLGLQVEDGWTGRRRDTATLSGGETFMTALSLALGLADVVTAEAGGRSIDALFIDEGFGTLDATSLDQVMDVLDELRTGGRLVGVVSHVADLKLRIPSQISVVKSETGSRVAVIGVG